MAKGLSADASDAPVLRDQDRIGRPARQGRSRPATYGVRGAFRLSWVSDSANLVTHSLQMKISVSLAKSWGSLTGYSAPKSVCTCSWDFLQNQHLNLARSGGGSAIIVGFSSSSTFAVSVAGPTRRGGG
jgi:hypothetical protein